MDTTDRSTLGRLIRTVRRRNAWTLRQMSEKIGIPLSTLSKVETNRLSLTYEKLQRIAARLGLTMAEFLAQAATPSIITARRSLTGDDNSVRTCTAQYDYQYLCADLPVKRIAPVLVRVRAQDSVEPGALVRHRGEEFIYVLDGAIEVHLEFYAPVTLTVGRGIYFDSTMGHRYVAKECPSALVLAVCSEHFCNTDARSLPPDTLP